MTLRARLTWLTAAAVAFVLVAGLSASFVMVRSQLHSQIDDSLEARAAQVQARPLLELRDLSNPRLRPPPPGPNDPTYVQLFDAQGNVSRDPQGPDLMPSEQALSVARGQADSFFAVQDVEGVGYRVLTVPLGQGAAAQVVRSLEETERSLRQLGVVFLLLGLGGVFGAAVVGRGVAGRGLVPVKRLTESVREVALTGDASRRVSHLAEHEDEIGTLAASFDATLAKLEAALEHQRQLVRDASHELRTPLTSLRTNVEMLPHWERLEASERKKLVADVLGQVDELVRMSEALFLLTQTHEHAAKVRLDELAAEMVERARRLFPAAEITFSGEPNVVFADRGRLERAVLALLDNAVKWGGDGPIEVRSQAGRLEVEDRGPGIPEADQPHVFKRFWRAPKDRALAGSGLGLSLVRQVAEEGGGDAYVVSPPPRAAHGAVVGFWLPLVDS